MPKSDLLVKEVDNKHEIDNSNIEDIAKNLLSNNDPEDIYLFFVFNALLHR